MSNQPDPATTAGSTAGSPSSERVKSQYDDYVMPIAKGYDSVGETRGLDLMYGVELVADADRTPAKEAATAVREHMRDEHNVLIGVGGYHKNVLRFQPPLTIDRSELERGVDALESGLRAAE